MGFSKVIGTSGSIRAIGDVADDGKLNTVNAETVKVKDIEKIVDKLLDLPPENRSEIPGISENRVDAIHLGGLLLLEILKLAEVRELTLSDASLREGLIVDYVEKNGQKLEDLVQGKSIRERSCLLKDMKYESDMVENKHVARLALQLFDQLKEQHGMNVAARDLLYHSCLIYNIGTFVNFQDYHKHSKYLILHGSLRGFNNKELFILANLARYHRKSGPKKKKLKDLDKKDRRLVLGLSGILRIAVGLDKTKNQWVENVFCIIQEDLLTIKIFGDATMDLELWEAQRFSDTLGKFLGLEVEIVKG